MIRGALLRKVVMQRTGSPATRPSSISASFASPFSSALPALAAAAPNASAAPARIGVMSFMAFSPRFSLPGTALTGADRTIRGLVRLGPGGQVTGPGLADRALGRAPLEDKAAVAVSAIDVALLVDL